MRLVSVRSRVRTSLGAAVRVGVVGNISACHADAPGSIPGHGAFFLVPFFSSAAHPGFRDRPTCGGLVVFGSVFGELM